jgi:hypothetical protein
MWCIASLDNPSVYRRLDSGTGRTDAYAAFFDQIDAATPPAVSDMMMETNRK